KLYDVKDGEVTEARVLPTDGCGHGALAGFLKAHGADTLICGGLGGGARAALAEAGIRVYGGASGDADAAVQALLRGELAYEPDATCT
ncbi:NifB/NifX family molybdenum-iron cluster-binding protein, partial [Pseudomonas syringae pv. tagetis]|uniref:NifB/NifX family molybdenum-iron cluster-binding protein n=1 Tax=Pseudomonas syringae group genomosp. 7 TaxID=251699 RepID=UPI00376FECB0